MSQLGVNLLNVMQNVTAVIHSAECQSAESRFDECHGAILTGCLLEKPVFKAILENVDTPL
jgi:hypothetical protein